MQGTIDIMSFTRNSNTVKQKANLTDSNKGFDKNSFKTELDKLRSYKQTEQCNETDTKDNKLKILSKTMSNSKANIENVENASNDEIKQIQNASNDEIKQIQNASDDEIKQIQNASDDEIKQIQNASNNIEADVKAEKDIDEDAKSEGDIEALIELTDMVKSEEELMSQLLQLINNADASKTAIEQKSEFLDIVSQKLEQLLSEASSLNSLNEEEALKALKTQIEELIKQPKTELNVEQISVEKAALLQKASAIMHLLNKMNEIKPELQRKLNEFEEMTQTSEQTVKAADKEIISANKIEMPLNENKKIEQNIEFKSKAETDVKKSDDKETSNKTTKEAIKHLELVDKPNVKNHENSTMPQVDRAAFQVELKEINLNVKKEAISSINKSEIINQVVKKADIILREGHSEMLMKLEPESLGKLNLKIVVENGLVTAKFIAESQQVKEILESNFNQLKDALQEKGIAVQNFSVSVGQGTGDSSSNQSFNQWKQSIKIKNKSIGEFMELDDQMTTTQNPYSLHEGRIDFRA